jgi:RNA polymerase sigma factor (sigma-70 family)
MASAVTKRLIVHSDRGALDEVAAEASDERLLHEFLHGHAESSEAAFRTVVKRHGPMVMGVCRQVLNQDHDAEDAFQATFLVLARKADTIRDHRLLSAWLYEVAYRISIRARSTAARRRDQEIAGAAMSTTTTMPQHENEAAWAELRPVLHDELNRLPEKYRIPIILSYLEGRTNEEVAGLLSWPVGTVKGRLSRARDLLRTRLVRRGLVLSAAFLCSALSHGVIFAEVVPESLVDRSLTSVLDQRTAIGSSPSDGLVDSGQLTRLVGVAVHVFAALIVLAMLSSLVIFTDPGTANRFKSTAAYLVTGQSYGSCHSPVAASGSTQLGRNEGR